jgi:DNA-binding NarL/FixJ family response regulator
VDDHPVVRRGLQQLLSEQPGLAPAREAGNAAEVQQAVSERRPDLVLMDIMLGSGTSGIDLIKQLHAAHPEMPVLAVSMHDEALFAARALAAGAQGYIMKRAPDEELVRAVRHVLDGGST